MNSVLEKVMQMKNMGMSEQEIVSKLKEEGIPPKTITDSLSQIQIKNAVEGIQGDYPQLQEMNPQQEMYSPQQPQDRYYNQQEQQYQPETGYSQQSGLDTGTIMEIAEQVVSEKIRNIQNQIDSLNEFKTITQAKIDLSIERLKRIESIIDKLQISILEKVSSYGQNLDSVKKEINMMQDSFSKVVNKVADNSDKDILKKLSDIGKEKTGKKKK